MRTLKTLTVLLLAGLSGCAFGRPALVVEMNGRQIEFDEFQSGKVPKGVEVLHFDSRNIKVDGNKPIEVNGTPVIADEDSFTIGGRKVSLDKDAKVRVRSGGEIEVNLPKGAPPPPPTPEKSK